MKSIKGKAKAYDEALKEAVIAHKDEDRHLKATLERIFPELKESEESYDERIKKAIKYGLDYVFTNNTTIYETTKEQCLFWLEKQGKKKSIWHNEDEEPQRGSLILLIMQSGNPIVAKIIEPNHTFNHGERWAYIDDLLDKQGEQKQVIDYSDSFPKDNWELIHEFVNKFGRVPKDKDELNVLIEYVLRRQKPAWSEEVQEEQVNEEFINALGTMLNDGLPDRYLVSEERIKKSAELLFSIARKQLKNEMQGWSEEDENIAKTIINEFEQSSEWYCANGLTKEDCIAWLSRQMHTKWSEEDKNKVNNLYVLLDQMVSFNMLSNKDATEFKDWLKSLRPQNTWKPSDEQMNALEHFVRSIGESGYASPYDNNTKLLYSLLSDLKKLKW